MPSAADRMALLTPPPDTPAWGDCLSSEDLGAGVPGMWTPLCPCCCRRQPQPLAWLPTAFLRERRGRRPGWAAEQRRASERGSLELHSVGFSQGLHWRRETRVRRRCMGADSPAQPPREKSLLQKPPLDPERGGQRNRSQFLFSCLILRGYVLGGRDTAFA